MFTTRSALLLASALILPGCSRGPNVVEVEGVLKLRGKPLPGIMVCFVPDAAAGTLGPRSTGWTDAQGHYRLTCDEPRKPGAVVGQHCVTVLDPEAIEEGPLMSGTLGKADPAQPKGKKPKRLQFDVKYLMPGQTPLRVEVQAPGPQTIDLNVE
jgi:hypothetical protein